MTIPLAALLALILSGPAPAPIGGDCTCAAARLANGWCDPCAIGYVASVEVRSKMLYEFLDAHGHDIKPASIECGSCQAALETDGFCERCRWGFVDKKLYFSRLTYQLARGEVKDVSKLTCRACAKNAAKAKLPLDPHRWCEQCKVGMVGNVAFKEKKDFEAASRELDRLLRAVRATQRCEQCAVALMQDATCLACGITYKNGTNTQSPPPVPHKHPHPH
jgi:hypothetical protein